MNSNRCGRRSFLKTLPGAALWLSPVAISFAGEKTAMPLQGLCGAAGRDPDGLIRISELMRLLEKNPHISGILLNEDWQTLEPTPGKYDWKNLDDAVALVRSHKRFYKLKLHPGTSTPDWVYAKGAAAFGTLGTNPHRKSTYKKPLRLPVPWDPVFLRHYEGLIRAAGARYADDPRCAGVTIAGANYQSAETHLPKEPADRDKWDQLNYLEHLPRAYRRLIDIFAAAFPKQQLCLHAAVAIRRDDGVIDSVIADAAKRYPDRFTLQNCQLSGKRDNASLYSYGLIQQYTGRLHVGYQSLAYLGSERQGDTQVSVYNYVRGQGEYWELWRGNALDPELCQWLLKEIARAKKMGAQAYRDELLKQKKKF